MDDMKATFTSLPAHTEDIHVRKNDTTGSVEEQGEQEPAHAEQLIENQPMQEVNELVGNSSDPCFESPCKASLILSLK